MLLRSSHCYDFTNAFIIGYLRVIVTTLSLVQIVFSQTLTLYHQIDGNEKFDLSVENCTDSLPNTLVQELICRNFSVQCARFYDAEGCRGNSVEMQSTNVASKLPLRFGGIKSIGPCNVLGAVVPRESRAFDKDTNDTAQVENDCSESNTTLHNYFLAKSGHKDKILDEVELFDRLDYKGQKMILPLKIGHCSTIPRSMQDHLTSIRFKSCLCIELHDSSDCSQDFISMRRQIPPKAINLPEWGLTNKVRALALCSSPSSLNRNLSIDREKYNVGESCDKLSTTFYDEKNFKGNVLSLTVRSHCLDLPSEWQGAAESIKLSQHCVIIYTSKGCPEDTSSLKSHLNTSTSTTIHRSYILLLNETLLKENNSSFLGFHLEKWGIDGQIRSVGPCDEDMPRKSPAIALAVVVALFIFGIGGAAILNNFVLNRDNRDLKNKLKEVVVVEQEQKPEEVVLRRNNQQSSN